MTLDEDWEWEEMFRVVGGDEEGELNDEGELEVMLRLFSFFFVSFFVFSLLGLGRVSEEDLEEEEEEEAEAAARKAS